jgi:NAD(P)-dependent dehydrogenase (short-subunit alcohol dehydrogenase family)
MRRRIFCFVMLRCAPSGVYEFNPIEQVTEENFHRMFNINVLGALLTTQAALKHMSAGGSIINIGSGVSRLTPPNSAVYTATKASLDAITARPHRAAQRHRRRGGVSRLGQFGLGERRNHHCQRGLA